MNKMELRVIKGLGVIRSIEHTDFNEDNRPAVDIIVIDCGEIPDGEDYGITNFFKDGDLYPDWPSDLDAKIDDLSWWITAVEGIKALGNEMFKKQDYKMALRKYRKAMQYLDFCWDLEDLDTGFGSSVGPKSLFISVMCRCKTYWGGKFSTGAARSVLGRQVLGIQYRGA